MSYRGLSARDLLDQAVRRRDLVIDNRSLTRELTTPPCPDCSARRVIVVSATEAGAVSWRGTTPHGPQCPAHPDESTEAGTTP